MLFYSYPKDVPFTKGGCVAVLLTLWPYKEIPLDRFMRERLECLEFHVRQSSQGSIRQRQYVEWLEDAGIPVPGHSTMNLDFLRYKDLCDDIEYGDGKRLMRINPHATRDACRWFLGEPWATSSSVDQDSNAQDTVSTHPLRPRLFSSVARCVLSAWVHGQEIELSYAAVFSNATYRVHRGVPVGVLPGSDSGYVRLWRPDGRVTFLAIERIIGLVKWTHASTEHYVQPFSPYEETVEFHINDESLLQRCAAQFSGLQRTSKHTAILTAPSDHILMIVDIVEAWIYRHRKSERKVERVVTIGEDVILEVKRTHGIHD